MATTGAVISVALTQLSSQRLGYHAISLTNFWTLDSEPEITAGSKVEIGGSLYNFSGTTTISGWSTVGTAAQGYLYMVPAGTVVTPTWAGTAPTWDEAQQAYYSGDDRAVGSVFKASTAGYRYKQIYVPFTRRQTFGSEAIEISADYTVDDDDGRNLLLITTGAGTVAVTLPTVSANIGRRFVIKKADNTNGEVEIDGEGAETIDGVTGRYLRHYNAQMEIEGADGEWRIRSGTLQTKLVDIGDWNMDGTASVVFAHALANWQAILDVRPFVRNDADTSRSNIDGVDSALISVQWNNTNCTLARIAGGAYDNVAYDSTGYNRGSVMIVYKTFN